MTLHILLLNTINIVLCNHDKITKFNMECFLHFRFNNIRVHSGPAVGPFSLRCLGFFFHRGINVFHTLPHLPILVKRNINKMAAKDWIIIGVSGVTCGGKTTLANKLHDLLTPVYVFHQDKYFYPDDSPNHVKCEGLDHNNYDILSSLDMAAMFKDIMRTVKGEDCSHSKSVERNERLEIIGKKFIVVEGFTVLNYKPIMDICDLRLVKIYFFFYKVQYGRQVVAALVVESSGLRFSRNHLMF